MAMERQGEMKSTNYTNILHFIIKLNLHPHQS